MASQRSLDPGVALLAALGAIGALFAYVSYSSGPSTLPAVLVGAGAVAVAVRRPAVGLAVALVLVPLGTFGLGSVGPLELPEWAPWSIWIGFMFVVAIASGRAEDWRLSGLGVSVFCYGLAGLLALGLTDELGDAVAATRLLLVGTALFVALALLVRRRADVEWALLGIAGTLTLVGALAALELVRGGAGGQGFITGSGELVGRIDLGFAHPNQFGGLLIILLPFAVAGALLVRRWRWMFLFAVALGTVGVYASFSRAALLGLVVIPFVFLRRRALWALPLLLLMVAIAAPDLLTERFATLTSGSSEVATRQDFWSTAAFIWSEHPIGGAGLSEFPDAYASARVPDKEFLPSTTVEPPPHAHNIFLNHLAEQGLIGFLALLALLSAAAAVALSLRRASDRWLRVMGDAGLAALLAFLLQNQFDVTLTEEAGVYFWMVLGLLSALAAIAAREAPRKPTVRPGP